jgi:hypothetical protein
MDTEPGWSFETVLIIVACLIAGTCAFWIGWAMG